MNILVLHNRYQHRGGEDETTDLEVALLRGAGHGVGLLEADNRGIAGRHAWRAGCRRSGLLPPTALCGAGSRRDASRWFTSRTSSHCSLRPSSTRQEAKVRHWWFPMTLPSRGGNEWKAYRGICLWEAVPMGNN